MKQLTTITNHVWYCLFGLFLISIVFILMLFNLKIEATLKTFVQPSIEETIFIIENQDVPKLKLQNQITINVNHTYYAAKIIKLEQSAKPNQIFLHINKHLPLTKFSLKLPAIIIYQETTIAKMLLAKF